MLNAENPLNHLKVLFVVENYLPTKNSGIENYTHWVASLLLKSGFRVDVAYLSLGAAKNYEYESVKVLQLPDHIISFEKLLREEKYDICHFQEFSGDRGIGIKWFQVAAANCTKVFFTFHLPYLTCYKGDFRYMDRDDCNDFSSVHRCVKCIVASKLGSEFLGGLVAAIGSGLSAINVSNPIKKLEEGILVKNTTLDQLIATCTNIFIYASWFKKILADNGYNQNSIKKIPYKTKSIHHADVLLSGQKPIKHKILFVGRIEKQKGLQLLCSAMNIIKTKIELDVFGNIVDQDYYDKCAGLHAFNFKGTTKLADLIKVLNEYDFLVLPSRFTEMFSMMVKDAFYEKLPVIVSASKGNIGAVEEGKSGFIFKYDDFKDLAKVIDKAYTLKSAGWEPEFAESNLPEQDIDEILSYYKI